MEALSETHKLAMRERKIQERKTLRYKIRIYKFLQKSFESRVIYRRTTASNIVHCS